MRYLLTIFLMFVAVAGYSDTVVAAKTIRANAILSANDIALNSTMSGGFSDPAMVIGMESKVVLYAGRPILPEHIGPPALVNRNQIVPLVFRASGLSISTAGRALDRGAEGEIIRVMNMSSRKTLFGTVLPDGSIDVTGF